jgi:hypothetical protein
VPQGMITKHPVGESPNIAAQLEAFARKRELALRTKIAKREAKVRRYTA